MSGKRSSKQHTFESSLKRLEAIVETLERGEVSLDDAIELYEEGVELSKLCVDKLKAAELRLKKLSRNVNNQFELTDLENDTE